MRPWSLGGPADRVEVAVEQRAVDRHGEPRVGLGASACTVAGADVQAAERPELVVCKAARPGRRARRGRRPRSPRSWSTVSRASGAPSGSIRSRCPTADATSAVVRRDRQGDRQRAGLSSGATKPSSGGAKRPVDQHVEVVELTGRRASTAGHAHAGHRQGQTRVRLCHCGPTGRAPAARMGTLVRRGRSRDPRRDRPLRLRGGTSPRVGGRARPLTVRSTGRSAT